jgi:diguanylate cyclase (GGDEF)-like protein/PAS domain S-box-containing protein
MMRDLNGLATSSYRLVQDSLAAQLSSFRYVFNSRGTPEIVDGLMILRSQSGDYRVNDNNELVDQIYEMSGSQATVFQKIGDRAVRISTNVKTPSGERAIGTIVSEPVYDAVINRGETFLGVADVVGTLYLTAYEPIRNADGVTIGILFVGITGEALYESMLPAIVSMDLGESGHIHAFEKNGKVVNATLIPYDNHPVTVDPRILQELTTPGSAPPDMVIRRNESSGDRRSIRYYSYVPELQWILGAHVYPQEFTAPLQQVRALLLYFLTGLVVLAAALSLLVGKIVSLSTRRLIGVTQKLTSGDLEQAEKDIDMLVDDRVVHDEFALIAKGFREAIHAVKQRDESLNAKRKQLAAQELEIRQSNARLEAIASATNAGIIALDRDRQVQYVNPRFSEIFGYEAADLADKRAWCQIAGADEKSKVILARIFSPESKSENSTSLPSINLEVSIRCKGAKLRAVLLTSKAVDTWQVVTLSDISEQKQRQETIRYLSQHDSLTGLPNRALLSERLNFLVTQTRRSRWFLCVGFLDLDGFKPINDEYGHEAGDYVLKEVATRLRNVLRDGDMVARLGGDEFAIVFSEIHSHDECPPLFQRLLESVHAPIHFQDQTLRVSASLGVTFYSQSRAIDGDQLLRQADQAMYCAKLAGRNRFAVFDAEQDQSIRESQEEISRISLGLEAEEFTLFYQPMVNLRTGRIIGVESLLRWIKPSGNILLPDAFLSPVYDHSVSEKLGTWILEQAFCAAETLAESGQRLTVSINVFPRQFIAPEFVPSLQRQLDLHPNVSAELIEFEIVETAAMNDLETAKRVIQACQEMGVSCCLDDFGTGFSSLSHLRYLPVSKLKIDRSFVRDMLDDPDDAVIIEGTLSLAQAFSRKVIAEGVETLEQRQRLLELGCESAQGYLIAPPMTLESLIEWMNNWTPPQEWQAVSNEHVS